jgi:uncharacterized protein (DUF1697 family)
MNTFIALYRGINVGGKNTVKMESLRAMHERLGHQQVQSYIQSGNIVFSATGSAQAISKKIFDAFLQEFEFAAKVIVIEGKAWEALVKGNPYTKLATQNHKSVHVAVCEGAPNAKGLKALLAKTGGGETFSVAKDAIYSHAPNGIGNSKFAAGMERASGVSITVRNWRTILALSQLANPGT